MIFWKFNVGDKLILNPENPKKDMESEYYVVDRYVDGVKEGLALSYPNACKMYVLYGVRHNTCQAVDEWDIMDKLLKNNGEVKRDALGVPKWAKPSSAYREALDEAFGREEMS